MSIDSHLERIYACGRVNDESSSSRSSKMLNITRSTGVFLDLLVTEAKPRRILELGTSNGYSTIWLARAAVPVGAHIDSVDVSPQKTSLASDNLTQCGMQDVVTLHTADCADFLRGCDSLSYDFAFLDSDRSAYCDWLADLIRVIRFGLLVVDNATTHQQELVEFKRRLLDDHCMTVAVLPIGNGQMIVHGGG